MGSSVSVSQIPKYSPVFSPQLRPWVFKSLFCGFFTQIRRKLMGTEREVFPKETSGGIFPFFRCIPILEDFPASPSLAQGCSPWLFLWDSPAQQFQLILFIGIKNSRCDSQLWTHFHQCSTGIPIRRLLPFPSFSIAPKQDLSMPGNSSLRAQLHLLEKLGLIPFQLLWKQFPWELGREIALDWAPALKEINGILGKG